ncbi:MAG: hypothetical protein ABSE73_16335 [Planctomycetota bacterium]
MRVAITVTAGAAKDRSFTFDQPDCFVFGRAADAKVSLLRLGTCNWHRLLVFYLWLVGHVCCRRRMVRRQALAIQVGG